MSGAATGGAVTHLPSDVPVLVVGAGPAGLTAAVTLARQGVECLVVDRRQKPSALPRATVVSLRTMELLRSWGLDGALHEGANDVEWEAWVCENLAAAVGGHAVAVGLPTRAQSAVISPTAPACAPQDHLEAVLAGHLDGLPAARVARGVAVVDLQLGAQDEGAAAVVEDVTTGEQRRIDAGYVVAADGAHSTVRDQLGIAMGGPGHLGRETFMVLFHAPLWDLVRPHRYGIYWVTQPEVIGSLLPAGVDDRWQYGFGWDPETGPPGGFPVEQLTGRLRRATGVADLEPRITRTGSFSFVAQIAERFRMGDVFLVGDAAHRVSPRGGTGMNTAIGDAHDLGWKLAWVLNGWASPGLLDSYEAERRPVAEHNVTRSADPAGSARSVAEELHADLGGRIAHAPLLTGPNGHHSTLDLLTPGFTLFTAGNNPTWAAAAAAAEAAGAGAPVTVRPLAGVIAARALGLRPGGALLVRPDGIPAAGWSNDATADSAISTVVASLVGPLPQPVPRQAPRSEARVVVRAVTAGEVPTVVEPLFRAYGTWLAQLLADGHGVVFTDADLERHHIGFGAELPHLLSPPGRLLVAHHAHDADEVIGVGALKPIDARTAEVKRMYVRPDAQGRGAGRAVLRHLIDAAQAEGFTTVRLETLVSMTTARALYRSLGFVETPAFDGSETAGTPLQPLVHHMELHLP